MAFEIDGAYGMEEVKISLPGGGSFTKTLDIMAVREALAAVPIAPDTPDAVANPLYAAVLEGFGVPNPGTHSGCIFIARYLMARREAVLKKFNGIEAAIIDDSPASPSSIPASTPPA